MDAQDSRFTGSLFLTLLFRPRATRGPRSQSERQRRTDRGTIPATALTCRQKERLPADAKGHQIGAQGTKHVRATYLE